MKQLALGALLVGFLVACGGGDSNGKIKLPDASTVDTPTQCNPLTQAGCAAGEKCTWIIDVATADQYVGHLGCAPDGTKAVGDACTFGAAGATGYDDCAKGGVCSQYGQPGQAGICKQVCDQQGGQPTCDDTHVCVTYADLFDVGENLPAAGGVCDLACNPLTDNDFDGSAVAPNTIGGPGKDRRSDTCGTDPKVGCYGVIRDTPPATGWSCTGDFNYENGTGVGLRHRIQCTDATKCARNGVRYVNSCNQGYLPMLRESAAVSEAICVALCKPADCYQAADGTSMCDTGDANRKGVAGDKCDLTDRRGKEFEPGVSVTSPVAGEVVTGGEHCMYSWYFEINDQGQWLKSPTSDSVGFCFDHSKYRYDAGGDSTAETAIPSCGKLKLAAAGTDKTKPYEYFGAADWGCVSSTTAQLATGKQIPARILEMRQKADIPRPLYNQVMAPPARN